MKKAYRIYAIAVLLVALLVTVVSCNVKKDLSVPTQAAISGAEALLSGEKIPTEYGTSFGTSFGGVESIK